MSGTMKESEISTHISSQHTATTNSINTEEQTDHSADSQTLSVQPGSSVQC